LSVFPDLGNATLIQGRGRCFEAKIEYIGEEGYVTENVTPGVFYARNRLHVFPNPENVILIQGRGWCFETKIENICAENVTLGFFYAENRLSVFPNPENSPLTLIQGRVIFIFVDVFEIRSLDH
jgi:hypothetical protein